MARDDATDDAAPSTTWEWKRVKMRRQPTPHQSEAEGRRRLPALRARDYRNRISLSVEYSGGPEAWWVIHARGREYRFPGVTALHDVMESINSGRGGHEPYDWNKTT